MCSPLAAAGAAFQGLGAIGSHQSASAAASAQNEAAINNYEYQLQVRENQHMQKLSAWANDRSVFSGKVQENFTAADKSYAAAQTVLNQEFDKAVVDNQAAFQKLIKAQGQVNTTAAAGKSKDRMGVMAMAALGRNQAIKSQSLTRAKEAFEAKAEGIRDQQSSANAEAYQKVALRPVEGVAPPRPVMAAGPSGLSLMAGLGSAVVGGFKSANAANALPNGQQLPAGTPYTPPSPATVSQYMDPINTYQSLNMSTYAPFAP